ncbi:MAG TPA: iron ABC transporter permease [Thermoanaerobaculia bacterium]|nr:iron ABC transporter permease [Thermoanaerobaculia bacterium]
MGTYALSDTGARRALWNGVLILGLALVLAIALATQLGAARVSLAALIARDPIAETIFLTIRLPRVLLAALVGAILAVTGLTFQTLLRNPLADPFILGVSGGAACGAAVATALGLARYPGVIPVVAFGGACVAMVAVLMLARRELTLDPSRLLLAGLVLNAFFSALILLALSLTGGSDLSAALRWMMGTFFSASWSDVAMLSAVLAFSLVALVALSGELRLMAFGEDDARSRGVNTTPVILMVFLVSSLATGAAVSVSGIIGFVGLLVPHAIRMIWKHDYRVLLPLAALGGGTLLVLADALSRSIMAPGELPIGALTALLGVPFFFVLLRRLAR